MREVLIFTLTDGKTISDEIAKHVPYWIDPNFTKYNGWTVEVMNDNIAHQELICLLLQ